MQSVSSCAHCLLVCVLGPIKKKGVKCSNYGVPFVRKPDLSLTVTFEQVFYSFNSLIKPYMYCSGHSGYK